MKLIVIIVNFNAGELLTQCVQSVLNSSIWVEIVIVDNASTDDSILHLKKALRHPVDVKIIENQQNIGFAKANNLALNLVPSPTEMVLFLNPDCIIADHSLEVMMSTLLAYPKVGMAGCLVLNPDGTEQAGCRRAIPSPWRALVRVLKLDQWIKHAKIQSFVLNHQTLPTHPVLVEAISGSFMLVRMEAIRQVGRMDEQYFLHCEDLDWCMRFSMYHYDILFVPHVTITHYKGTCSKNRKIRVLWHMHWGMIRFYDKFFREHYPTGVMWLVKIAVGLRFIILMILAVLSQLTSQIK